MSAGPRAVAALRTMAVVLVLAACPLAQEPPPVLRGTWTASGPRQVFQGSWSATLDTPDAARGSWVLLNEANQVVLGGTWAAEKSAAGWQGTWSARIVTGRPARGRTSSGGSFSGTWQAHIKDSDTKTLADMLHRTLQDQIAGTWRTGGLQGRWSLRGSPQPPD